MMIGWGGGGGGMAGKIKPIDSMNMSSQCMCSHLNAISCNMNMYSSKPT